MTTMLKSEFEASQRKLAHRSKEATEKAKRKLEREKILSERRKAREEALEKQKQERRLAQIRLEEEEREKLERLQQENNGVVCCVKLQAVPAPANVASNKGIKRAADKLLLPPSVGSTLMDQKAYKNGAYFFQLTNELGRSTHAALLEFSSAEGFISLPQKVMTCLWGPDAKETDVSGTIEVVYKSLPKGTKVVFQPRSAEFQSFVGDDVREVLEKALLCHSCLSIGDWIELEHNDVRFQLRVRELEPAPSVSIIDTEMEAEIHPSIETEEKILAEEMAARKALEEKRKAEEEEVAKRKIEHVEEMKRIDALDKIRNEKLSTLVPEPEASSTEPNFILLIRFPDGSKHSRRFLLSDKLHSAFHFADAMGASGYFPGEYNLVTQFPRHLFQSAEDCCFGDTAIFTPGGRHVVFLEPISSAK